MRIYCSVVNFYFQKNLMQDLKRNLCLHIENMTLNCMLQQRKSYLSHKILYLHAGAHFHTPIRWLRGDDGAGRDCHVHGFESCSLLLFRSLSIIQANSKTRHFVSFQCTIFSDKMLSLGRKKYGSPSFVKRYLFCSRNTYVFFTCSLVLTYTLTRKA